MKLSLQYRKQFKVALPWILWATFLMEDFTTVLNLEACLKHSEASFFSAKSNCASFSSNMTLDQQKSYCKQSKILGLCLLARRYKRLQEKAIYFVLSSFSRESHSSENYHTLIEGLRAKRAYIEFWPNFIFCRIELIFGRLTCFDMKSIVP